MSGKGDGKSAGVSKVDDGVDEARLRETQVSEYRRMNENMMAMREMLERMDLRLREVEKGTSSSNEGNRGGKNTMPPNVDLADVSEFLEEDYDDNAGLVVNRGGRG